MAGAFCYYYLELIERRAGYFIFGAIAVLVTNMIWPLTLLEPFALTAVVVFFGLFFYVGNFGKYGDISYGVYILHFPVVQLLIYLGWSGNHPWLFLFTVILITTSAAIVSWHLVEKRFLLRNSHYVATTIPTSDKVSGASPNTDEPTRRIGKAQK